MDPPVLRTMFALTAALGALGPVAPSRAQENLLIMETTLPREADQWYQRHHEDALPSEFSFPFAHVYARPGLDAPVVGALSAVARWDPYVHFAWVFRADDSDGAVVWREDVGDWGYGIEQFVVDTVRGWVQLPPGPYGSEGWVRLLPDGGTDGFEGEVGSISGRLVDVDSVVAEVMESGERGSVGGTMLIESIDKAVVNFRPEVPSDMPCSPAEESVPDPEVPHYRAPVSSFLTNELQPKFVIAYPKGC